MTNFNFNEFLSQHYKAEQGTTEVVSNYNAIADHKAKAEQYITRIAETNDDDLLNNLSSNKPHADVNANKDHDGENTSENSRENRDEQPSDNNNLLALNKDANVITDDDRSAFRVDENHDEDPFRNTSNDTRDENPFDNHANNEQLSVLQDTDAQSELSPEGGVLNYEFGSAGTLAVKGGAEEDALNIDMSNAKSAWIMKIELDDNTAIEITDAGITSITGENFVSANDSLSFIELSDQSGTIEITDHTGTTEVIDFSGLDNIFWS